MSLIQDRLLSVDSQPLGRVFYLKLAGDFTRYLCEISTGDERQEQVRCFAARSTLESGADHDIDFLQAMSAERLYALALEAACNNKIRATNVVRLGLALNTALFFDEIHHRPQEALRIAKEAFDVAMVEVTTLQVRRVRFVHLTYEDSAVLTPHLHVQNPEYSDATRLMAILDDNITLWSARVEGLAKSADDTARP